jgi:hypothetical protein
MRKKLVLVVLALLLGQSALWAHSTSGLVRVKLEKERPTVDDLAFYAERWVGKRADEDGRRGRFLVLDFGEPAYRDARLLVPIKVFDQKKGVTHPEVLVFERGPGKTWNHVDEAGKLITAAVTTYVKPRPKGFWLLAGGLALALGLEGLIRARRLLVRRREQAGAEAA